MSWLSLRLYVAGMLEHTWTYYIWIRHEVSHLWTTIVSLAIEHWDWLGPSSNVETSMSYRPTMSHVTLEDWVGASTRPVLDRSSLLRTNGFQLASTLHRRPTPSALLLGKTCKHRFIDYKNSKNTKNSQPSKIDMMWRSEHLEKRNKVTRR